MNAVLGRDWLSSHLPHAGAMNLLETVVRWDASSLHAIASRHRDPANPLRRAGILPPTAGIEYGAQAAAAHGALSSGAPSGFGMIAAVRSVVFHAPRLDVEANLDVRVEQLAAGPGGVLYRFEVSADSRPLVEGRVTVAFGK